MAPRRLRFPPRRRARGRFPLTGTAVNSANYSLSSTTEASGYVPVSGLNDELFTVQNAGGSYNVDLGAVTGLSTASALTAINSALSGSGIYAVTAPDTNDITFQSSNVFSVNETQLASTGGLFTTLGAQTPTAPAASASDTGNALAALTLLTQAISNLGLVQGQRWRRREQIAVRLQSGAVADYERIGCRIRHSRRRRCGGGGQSDQGAGAAADFACRAFAGKLRSTGGAGAPEELLTVARAL